MCATNADHAFGRFIVEPLLRVGGNRLDAAHDCASALARAARVASRFRSASAVEIEERIKQGSCIVAPQRSHGSHGDGTKKPASQMSSRRPVRQGVGVCFVSVTTAPP